jgi:hypothetical protein
MTQNLRPRNHLNRGVGVQGGVKLAVHPPQLEAEGLQIG